MVNIEKLRGDVSYSGHLGVSGKFKGDGDPDGYERSGEWV